MAWVLYHDGVRTVFRGAGGKDRATRAVAQQIRLKEDAGLTVVFLGTEAEPAVEVRDPDDGRVLSRLLLCRERASEG